uniref:PPM-type phosphatase domain-containing protein n=1 Tax=Chrysotila carterae TaxID=13221 RepID=A0A6S9USW0_CHRCT|mmetsp:Transcript_23667/g.51727  ORF Transcript_23667/g.51727 Transcript_23667/m.51727 type:complete len:411 (+) Transcript_23667:132-1364(+)
MGNTCAKTTLAENPPAATVEAMPVKSPPATIEPPQPQPALEVSNVPSDPEERNDDSSRSASPSPNGKGKTFRERRLSVAQNRDPQAKGKARRLSVYGSGGDGDHPTSLVPPIPACGCKSVAGLEPVPGGSVSKINQDRAVAIYPYFDDKATGLFGVFDGHGRVGEQVSQYVIEQLPDELANHEKMVSDPGTALRESFVEVDRTLADAVDASVSGTTAVACLIRGNHLWLANSGDSRAIIARQKPKSTALKAIDLTRDQKPDSPDEMRRILQMGGHITPAGANGSPSRVWHNLRGLAMARSIGDHHAATVGVIAEPEITEYDITDDDVALIIASDGVWELLSSQTVVDILSNVKNLDPMEICNNIIEQASYMWKVEEGDYRDDITVVVVTFPWLDSYGDDEPSASEPEPTP